MMSSFLKYSITVAMFSMATAFLLILALDALEYEITGECAQCTILSIE